MRRYLVPLAVMAFFVVVGIVFLLASRAATPSISKEPENGAITEPAEIVSDPQASNGKAVQFKTPPADTGLEDIPTCDTGTNVTFQLNQYFKSQVAGSTIVFPANRCYISDSVLHLDNLQNITIDGNGSTIKRVTLTPEDISYPQITIEASDTLTLKNITVEGVNTVGKMNKHHEHDANVQIKSGQNITLDHITGRKAGGDFVFIGPIPGRSDGSGTTMPKNIKVINSSSNITGRNGISCVGCEDVLVDNVTFDNTGYIGFDLELEAAKWYGRNITLSNTTWGEYGLKWFNSSGSGLYITNLTITNNVMTKRSTCQPTISMNTATARQNVVITNNRLLAYTTGMGINRTDGLTVTGNRVIVANGQCGGDMWGLLTDATGDVIVRDNDYSGSATPFGLGVKEGPNNPGYVVCNNRIPGSDLFEAPKVCGTP